MFCQVFVAPWVVQTSRCFPTCEARCSRNLQWVISAPYEHGGFACLIPDQVTFPWSSFNDDSYYSMVMIKNTAWLLGNDVSVMRLALLLEVLASYNRKVMRDIGLCLSGTSDCPLRGFFLRTARLQCIHILERQVSTFVNLKCIIYACCLAILLASSAWSKVRRNFLVITS